MHKTWGVSKMLPVLRHLFNKHLPTKVDGAHIVALSCSIIFTQRRIEVMLVWTKLLIVSAYWRTMHKRAGLAWLLANYEGIWNCWEPSIYMHVLNSWRICSTDTSIPFPLLQPSSSFSFIIILFKSVRHPVVMILTSSAAGCVVPLCS